MRVREPLLAVAASLLLLGAAEGLLLAAGVPTLASESDPFQGFSERMRVYELDSASGSYRTRPQAERLSFNPQEFLAEKPADGLRVFVIGGSSAYGFPWSADEAFSSALGAALAASHPDRRVEVVNAAAMSYASHRLRVLVGELVRYEPDLLVVYSGHNEFIERRFHRDLVRRPRAIGEIRGLLHHTRLYSSLARFYRSRRGEAAGPGALANAEAAGAAALLGLDVEREPPGELARAEREEIVRAYEANLRAIVDLAQAAGARVALCTVASNWSGWAPNRSAFEPGTDAAVERRVRELLARAGAQLAADPAAAARELERARELAPGYARTHYELGRALAAQGRADLARESFARAVDLDASPSRAPSGINAAIRRVAAESRALLVDVEAALLAEAPGGAPGFELFEDYVHPKPETHVRIAREIWAALESSGALGEARAPDPALFDRALAAREPAPAAEGSLRAKQATQLFNLAVVLEHQGLPEQAIAKLRECLALAPEYTGARNNLAWLLHQRGEDAEAVSEYRALLRQDPGNGLALAGLGETLRAMGRLDAAARVLERAIRGDPGYAPAFGRLAAVRYDERRYDLAEAAARRAVELDPSDSDSRAILGLSLLEQGRHDEARAALEAGIERSPAHPAMLEGLARLGRSGPPRPR
jgi:tetratricopeptide (TPR) repeat protein